MADKRNQTFDVQEKNRVRFDWHSFCTKHNVTFVTSGPNTARGHVSIRCPWCGDADRSQHMGLSLDRNDPAWGCFRNSAHRGRNPRRLVQRLLGVSFDEAWRIVQEQGQSADDDELDRSLSRLRGEDAGMPPNRARNAPGRLNPEGSAPTPTSLPFPTQFRPVLGRAYGRQFLQYLEGRGFPADCTGEVCERYGLHYALTGDYAWRLIFPICDLDGRLAGWTGRDIRPQAWLRYRSSLALPNRIIYNQHLAARSAVDTLVIVEGPIDAVKVDFFGASLGVTAVATLGTALPRERRAALAALARRFKRTALLFDEDTLSEVVSLAPELSETVGYNVELWRPGVKDPGGMLPEQVVEFLREQINE